MAFVLFSETVGEVELKFYCNGGDASGFWSDRLITPLTATLSLSEPCTINLEQLGN